MATRQRVLTAAALIPPLLVAVLWLPNLALALLLVPIVTLAAHEWSGLAGLGTFARRGYVAVTLLALALMAWLVVEAPEAVLPVVGVVVAFWSFTTLRLVVLERRGHLGEGPAKVDGLLGVALLAVAWLSLVTVHGRERGPELLIALFLLVWMADTAAWFGGRHYGRRKLAPSLSPGKTREGLRAGLAGALLVAALEAWWFDRRDMAFVRYAVIALITVLASVVGDLYESLLKRRAGVKDSGRLLPGHGGILDRIDSLLAAAPVFLCGLLLEAR